MRAFENPAAILCATLSVMSMACEEDADGEETVRLGLMLPYTGALSTTSRNHERAVLFARREAASAGIAGKRLELVYADSHSDAEQGLAAVEGLLAQDVVAVIGFEIDELAEALRPRLAAEGVVLITPSISAPVGGADEAPWFRVAPSTQAMAENLAKSLFERDVQRVSVVHTSDIYNRSFAEAFSSRMSRLGGEVPTQTVVRADDPSYPEVLAELADDDAILLSVPAATAARVVNEFDSVGRTPRWFMPPALRSESFVLNVSPLALQNAIGISPETTVDEDFAAEFAEAFHGDRPSESTLFYYDATALFLMGYERAAASKGGLRPSAEELAAGVFAAAFPVGIETKWNELPDALEHLRAGGDRYYRGLTGRIAFDADGERGVGMAKFWAVARDGTIVDLE